MIIQKYEIDINLTHTVPCFCLYYVTLLTTRKLVSLSMCIIVVESFSYLWTLNIL